MQKCEFYGARVLPVTAMMNVSPLLPPLPPAVPGVFGVFLCPLECSVPRGVETEVIPGVFRLMSRLPVPKLFTFVCPVAHSIPRGVEMCVLPGKSGVFVHTD